MNTVLWLKLKIHTTQSIWQMTLLREKKKAIKCFFLPETSLKMTSSWLDSLWQSEFVCKTRQFWEKHTHFPILSKQDRRKYHKKSSKVKRQTNLLASCGDDPFWPWTMLGGHHSLDHQEGRATGPFPTHGTSETRLAQWPRQMGDHQQTQLVISPAGWEALKVSTNSPDGGDPPAGSPDA